MAPLLSSCIRGISAAASRRSGAFCRALAPSACTSSSSSPFQAPCSSILGRQCVRPYLHYDIQKDEDFELPMGTMPEHLDEVMKLDPSMMDFFENYWYWTVRGQANILDPEGLPKKTYEQLARDLGLQLVNPHAEHMVGLIELYEYLKSSPFIGPFGTIENPVVVPSAHNERFVCCTGGAGDDEHVPLWFICREGFLYRCAECDQIFMLVRVLYSLPDGKEPFPVDPDINDVFDMELLEKGNARWNTGEYLTWPVGYALYRHMFMKGKWGNQVPTNFSGPVRTTIAD